jgi:hypothetical protein
MCVCPCVRVSRLEITEKESCTLNYQICVVQLVTLTLIIIGNIDPTPTTPNDIRYVYTDQVMYVASAWG